MEPIQNQDPELNQAESSQDSSMPVDAFTTDVAPVNDAQAQPVEEPQPTNAAIVKQAFKYLLWYIGLVIAGMLLMALPVLIMFAVFDKLDLVDKTIIKDWQLAVITVGAQLLPLYVFWKKKWCDFSWVKMPNLGKMLLWIFVAWLGYLFIDSFVVEVYTMIGIDVDAQTSISEEGAIPLNLISCCILAPLCEEAFYRGTFERQLLKTNWNPWYAIVISAFVFALMHFDLYVSTLTFGAGLLMGWIFYRTRNIWLTVFLHFVNNTFSSGTDLLDTYFEDPFSGMDYPFYGDVILLVVGIVLLCVAVRAIGKIMARNEQTMELNKCVEVNDPPVF